ncbi:NAD(P)/FAD-dependent oxidoreductase [Pollutimonas bauzanensis]|uniref:Glycine/D-amino acid oxidase n=1 Tax=Pollutimonas bauzanensis TaxID=658167 RepID=A0A1M5ZNC6_9BURK|nr:FAD-binding oxidoreductase [Pollutimonas bauzanensis]SHI25658.1 Glycine/D-amino acid oxidase [Pollutimonas bauzanensis]
MSLHVVAVQSDDALPDAVDVVVIGGGIIGVATAYELARKGLSVALMEKGRVAAEQSSRNWGWCRQQNRDPRELPLIKYSLRRWGELAGEIGADLGFRRAGLSYVTTSPADLAAWEDWNRIAREYEIDSRMVSGAEARVLTPGAAGQWIGGMSCPSDGRAEPALAAPALAAAARKLGVTIHQNCAARGLDTAAGRVSGVITEKGLIRTQAVVCAAGAWASMFCRRHGIDLPQAGVYSTSMRTEPAAEVMTGGLSVPGLTLRRRLDGGYTLGLGGRGRLELSPQGLRYARKFLPTFRERHKGLKIRIGRSFLKGPEAYRTWGFEQVSPFEEIRVLNPAPDMSLVREAEQALGALYPALAGIRVAEAWGGFIDNTPDAIPVISALEALPGFFLSTGYSGHGFGIGLGAGRLTADLVAGAQPIVPPGAFRHSRLVDGTDLGKPGMM